MREKKSKKSRLVRIIAVAACLVLIFAVSTVTYRKHRAGVSNMFQHITNAKMISLEDAEVLLYNGYVFGGHSCSLCMAMQDKISFYGYDFVDIDYLTGNISQDSEEVFCIPFYAFYKEIGTSENGNLIYAKTYVPAIEVSGYKEYFESQKANHK